MEIDKKDEIVSQLKLQLLAAETAKAESSEALN